MKIQQFLKEITARKREEMEDVLLIHVDSYYNLLYSFYNLGLLSMATVLQQAGFKARCISSGNIFFLNQHKMKSMITKFSPRIVGLYVNSDNIHNVIYLASDIKNWVPGVRIVVGGPLATIKKEELLDIPVFDFVVPGEGEIPLLGLTEYYIKGKGSLKEIPSLIYRVEGQVVINPRCEPIKDLDSLPPINYDLVNVNYGFFYSTGRGCPFKCSFCFQEVHGKGYRFHSAERVVNDIVRTVEKYNSKTVNIVDDTFIAKPERVDEICRGLIEKRKEKNLDFIFFCEGRVDIFDRHPELLEKLKDAGMARLQIGVETGNQEILDAYNKKITIAQIEKVMERIGSIGGFSAYGNFIIGGPHETRKTFEKSVAFAKKLLNMAPGGFECATSFLCPFPGTDIGEHPEKYGLICTDQDWRKGLTMSDANCYSEALSINDIRAMEREFLDEIGKEMRKVAIAMDPAMMERHFNWALRYKMHTLYYLNVFMQAPILESYFSIKKSAKFRRLQDIPEDQLTEHFPLRIMEKRLYSNGGDVIELPGYFRKVTIRSAAERTVYEYSAGKMNIGEIADASIADLKSDLSRDEFIRSVMLPLYRRIEKSYHIVFYR
jgi:radical SAM superfamily enzyme YgiQ (UPF0313 family)